MRKEKSVNLGKVKKRNKFELQTKLVLVVRWRVRSYKECGWEKPDFLSFFL